MSENEKLHNLLRLKRYETPGEDHVDQVLEQFRERRDREKAEQTSHTRKAPIQEQVMIPFASWFDKLNDWYAELGRARWALPVGTAAAAAVALASFSNRDGMVQEIPASAINQTEEEPQNMQLTIKPSTTDLQTQPSSSKMLPASTSGLNR